MDYTITIPDELIPGIVAIAYTEGKQPTDIIQEYATTAANKACQDYQVGPYWVMPEPRFNADGTPYVPPQADEIPTDGEVITEPEPQVNDTSLAEEGV